jgi:PBP1b-binding outer membrane lipoprotein LpoB
VKSLFLILLIINFFTACSNDEVTKEDCEKEGKKLKITKFLNLRNGEYEMRKECVN